MSHSQKGVKGTMNVDLLRRFAVSNALGYKELAERLGVSIRSICYMFNGIVPQPSTVERLSLLMKTPVKKLIIIEKVKKTKK